MLTTPRKRTALLFALLFIIGAVLVIVAPNESTLGSGIKPVYIHVALMWAGALGLLATGGFGLLSLITDQPRWPAWGQITGWVGLIVFVAGVIISMVAAQVNWGGVDLQEPVYTTSFRVTAVSLIVLILSGWLKNNRITGLAFIVQAAFLLIQNSSTRLILHPGNAAVSSEADPIRTTFFALFVVYALAGALVIWHIQRHERPSIT